MLVATKDDVDRGLLRVEQARAEAELGDAQQALGYAREADELLRDHVRHRANGWHALALALAAAGETDAAVGEFDRAIADMLDRGQWRQALVVARDEATALRAAGRDAEAYAVLERSTTFSSYEAVATTT
jgi:tetratricopeptide (TPR) repeat protein